MLSGARGERNDSITASRSSLTTTHEALSAGARAGVSAILRRVKSGSGESSEVQEIGPLRIDRTAHRVTVDGRDVELTPTEFKLLLLLAERKGRVQPRNMLLEIVWEAAPDIQTRTVDMHVQRLRAKLGAAGDMIETVRGFGYRLRGGQPRTA